MKIETILIQLKCIEKTMMIDKVQNVIILCLRDKVLRMIRFWPSTQVRTGVLGQVIGS